MAIFRPSSGQWFVRGNAAFPVTFGTQRGDVALQVLPAFASAGS